MNELENLLKNTPDAYDDYVRGCLFLAKEYEIEARLIAYMQANKNASTSEVLEMIDKLAGIEPTPLEIVG